MSHSHDRHLNMCEQMIRCNQFSLEMENYCDCKIVFLLSSLVQEAELVNYEVFVQQNKKVTL